MWVDPWQTNDIYNHLNVIVGAEGIGMRGITDIMKILDGIDVAKNRPWGLQELLSDFWAQASGRLRNDAIWTGDHEEFRRRLRRLLCE